MNLGECPDPFLGAVRSFLGTCDCFKPDECAHAEFAAIEMEWAAQRLLLHYWLNKPDEEEALWTNYWEGAKQITLPIMGREFKLQVEYEMPVFTPEFMKALTEAFGKRKRGKRQAAPPQEEQRP